MLLPRLLLMKYFYLKAFPVYSCLLFLNIMVRYNWTIETLNFCMEIIIVGAKILYKILQNPVKILKFQAKSIQNS